MSETDDTDDLLLIPPDLFVVDSEREDSIFNKKSSVPYYAVVDSLIEQVNNLEDRLNCLQTTSDVSLINSADSTQSAFMSEQRKFNSSEDLGNVYYGSAQSTPQKPKTKLHLQSLPNSPNTWDNPGKHNEFSPKPIFKSPPKRYVKKSVPAKNTKTDLHYGTASPPKNEILEEIDNFISNVKNIQRINAVRNLTYDFENPKANNRLDIKGVDSLFNNIGSEQTSSQSAITEELIMKQKTWQPGESVYTVPDYGSGMCNVMYNKTSQPVTESGITMITVTPLGSQQNSFSNISGLTEETSTTVSTDSIPTTAQYITNKAAGDAHPNVDVITNCEENLHAKALNMIDLHKKFMSETGQKPTNKPQMISYENNRNSLGMISLTELWSKQKPATGELNYKQKLEEEKLRRQHCEQLIIKLQSRTLELQERLAVAVQVDQAKDETILRFQKSWEEIRIKLRALNEEKASVEKQLNDIKQQKNKEFQEAVQKAQHYEEEVSKALDLAHINQEKCSSLESMSTDLKSKVTMLQELLEEKQNVYTCETNKTRQLSELLAQKEIELDDSKNILNEARKEIHQSKRAVELCQAELTSMKNECSQLHLKLDKEREHSLNLEKHKKKLLSEIESHKQIQKSLQDDLNKAHETNNQNKVELRNFYQDQVEAVVREKLQEFQLQLDKAESALQEELKNRELIVAKRAVDYIQQLLKKHTLEVQLLEEKHKEEIRLYQVKLSHNQQQIETLQLKFQDQQERRTLIAKQLQKVMEAQWIEALRIINNSKSPVAAQNLDISTIDQLNSLKSKSYTNFQEVLMNMKDTKEEVKKHSEENVFQPIESTSSIIDDTGNQMQMEDTPLSSRPHKNKPQYEYDLEKFIRMLLNKSPGNPLEEQDPKSIDHAKSTATAAWQPPSTDENRSKNVSKDKRFTRRPWK